MFAKASHTDARADIDDLSGEIEWLSDHRLYRFGDGDCLRLVGTRQHDRELIATEPGDQVGPAYGAAQPDSELLQQSVSALVAERVVDFFEAIQVHNQECQLPTGCDGLLEPLAEQDPIGQ